MHSTINGALDYGRNTCAFCVCHSNAEDGTSLLNNAVLVGSQGNTSRDGRQCQGLRGLGNLSNGGFICN